MALIETTIENVVTEPPKKKGNVLVIDDNAILLRTVKDMLSDEYDVTIAISGTQAFNAISIRKPDVILLDYEMPYADGAEVFCALKEMPASADIPVVFLTASADREVVTKLISLNPAGYLLKPPNKQKMLEMIEGLFATE